MSEIECYRCHTTMNAKHDQWYSYQWREQPAQELVEKAIEEKDFRDWFHENYVMCQTCHDKIQRVVNDE